ncbi:RNA-directed DNA polymerase, eukaryota [Tanacetum coccineum]
MIRDCCMIRDCWNNGWRLDWCRHISSGTNANQLASLYNQLSDFSLNNSEDTWIWSFGTSTFSVKSTHEHIDHCSLPNGGFETRWNRLLPKKINIFIWRVLRDRLPSRWNLSRKGVDVVSLSCPVCDGEIETIHHSLWFCSLATNVWNRVLVWLDLPSPNLANIQDLYSWLDDLHISSNRSATFEVICGVVLWSLWNFRNETIFGIVPPKRNFLFDKIVDCSFRCRELILFIGFLLLVPHCVHPLGFPMRDLLDHLPPRETSSVATTIATSHRGEFLAAAHEVPVCIGASTINTMDKWDWVENTTKTTLSIIFFFFSLIVIYTTSISQIRYNGKSHIHNKLPLMLRSSLDISNVRKLYTNEDVVRIRPTTRKGDVWSNYDMCIMIDGVEKARCKKCMKFYNPASNTTLRTHKNGCNAVSQNDTSQGTIGADGQVFIFDNDAVRLDFTKFVIQQALPFNHFDNVKLTEIIKRRLQPRYQHVSRTTLRSDAFKLWETAKKDIIDGFRDYKYGVSITTDTWTAPHVDKSPASRLPTSVRCWMGGQDSIPFRKRWLN